MLVHCPDDFDDFFASTTAADDAPPATDGQEALAPRMVPPRLGMLAELDDAEFDAVARAAKLQHLDADATVFCQGDEADRFFILVDGAVEVERDGTVLATLGPGAFFGESALLVKGLRSATVITVAPTSLWSIGYEVFDHAMSHHLLADDARRTETERRISETPRDAFRRERP